MKADDMVVAGFLWGFLMALQEVINSVVRELRELEEGDGLSDLGHSGRRKSALLSL